MRTDYKALTEACERCPHGTRARYVAGCRCLKCREANALYQRQRDKAIKEGDKRGLVPVWRAIRHIQNLSENGIGYKAVADAAGVSRSVVHRILWGGKKKIRKDTQARILSVDEQAAADHSRIPAGPTWQLLESLIEEGYTRTQIAKWLGSNAKTPALQLKKDFITAKKALAVEKLVAKLAAGKLRRDR
jgi:predicted transcriptional regulator